eukprot:s863_g2.t1
MLRGGALRGALAIPPSVVVDTWGDPTFADQDCAICAESFADTPTLPVVELPCQHRFHGACVQDLKDRRKTCPICRAEVDWRVVREVQMLPATNAIASATAWPTGGQHLKPHAE